MDQALFAGNVGLHRLLGHIKSPSHSRPDARPASVSDPQPTMTPDQWRDGTSLRGV